jgi:DNA invertase Pin-like site-specific DNA recombinase
MADARHGRFDVVLVWACDRIARSVRHFLEVLDELNHLNLEFVSFREQLDTGGPLGRAVVIIIGAIAELERNLIVERVRAGMRRAKLEGQNIGRPRLSVDREALLRDRAHGFSLRELAKMRQLRPSLGYDQESIAMLCKRSFGPRAATPQFIAPRIEDRPAQLSPMLPGS